MLAVCALLIVFAGFAPSFYLRSATRPSLTSGFLWHGIILTAWYVVAVLQSGLIALLSTANRYHWHRRLGFLSLFVAAGVVYSGTLVAIEFYRGGSQTEILSPAGLLVANLMNLVSFTVCVAAGIALRKRPELHKRFLSLAGIVMIGPAAFRLVVFLGMAPPVSLIVQFAPIAALCVYDRQRLQRVSVATYSGILLIVLMIVVTLAVG